MMNASDELYFLSRHLFYTLGEIQQSIYEEGQYFIGLQSLFNFVEQYFRVKTGDYTCSSKQLYTKCYILNLITEDVHKYLNEEKNSFRILRNCYSHRNIYLTSVRDLRKEDNNQYPLSEDSTIELIVKTILEDVRKMIGLSNTKEKLVFPFDIFKIEPIDLAKEFGWSESQFATMYDTIYYGLIDDFKIKLDVSFTPFESQKSLNDYVISILVQKISNSSPIQMLSSIFDQLIEKGSNDE